MTDPKDLVSVYVAAHAPDAHILKNVLEQEGITAFVAEDVEPLQGLSVDAPQVFVPQKDAARARAIVEEHNLEQIERAARPDWICPQCAATVAASFDECDLCGAYRPGAETAG